MFSSMGDANRSKIQRCLFHPDIDLPMDADLFFFRKLILCALQRHDADSTYQFTGPLFDPDSSDPLTIYLLVKVSLRNGDVDLGMTYEYVTHF